MNARAESLIGDHETFSLAQALITSRQYVSPKRLVEPGPTPDQRRALFALAAAAPDHGQLTPWRFIVVPPSRREHLAQVFAGALMDRDPGATREQVDAAREKAYRAPMLAIAVARLGTSDPDIAPLERMISMGAAIQNILLGAQAMGFGSGLTSGQAMSSPRMARLCALAEGEVAVCCINVGTVSKHRPGARIRPVPESFCSELATGSEASGR